MERQLINIHELSALLGVSMNTLYGWVNRRKIPYVKVGRLVKFDQRDIETWVKERKVDVWE